MPEPEPVTALDAIRVLNRIHAADPTVLPQLIAYRVPCNEALADDPTVQVGEIPDSDGWQVGFLGVLNGIFGVDANTWGYIAANFTDADGELTEFIRTAEVDPIEAARRYVVACQDRLAKAQMRLFDLQNDNA